ncbi:MAG TPA: hypothetical protein VJ808_06960 [Gemmatimonadales bacterium]|nr:hypothetical protein [Gemmatimonadales bacterium]
MKRIFFVLSVLFTLASQAEAQGLSPAVKYGKWALLAGAIGMNYLAVRAHDRAEDVFDALEAHCTELRERCDLGPDGSYTDPAIEDLYQTSLSHDRRARLWLIGGETALVGSAALFIWELARPKDRPDNIPFEPEVRSLRAGGTGLGLRLAF